MIVKYYKRLSKEKERLFRSILLTQEEERRRIARDIHDSLGGLLNRTKMILDGLREGSETKSVMTANINEAYDLVTQSVLECRNASNALVPEAIKRFGLKGAINDLKKKYDTFFQIEFTNECPSNLHELMQMHIYRILQELFNNALKYSEANSIELVITSNMNDELHITFKDNGKGFDFDTLLNKGNGLRNIKNRVELLKGEMVIKNLHGASYNFLFKPNNFAL